MLRHRTFVCMDWGMRGWGVKGSRAGFAALESVGGLEKRGWGEWERRWGSKRVHSACHWNEVGCMSGMKRRISRAAVGTGVLAGRRRGVVCVGERMKEVGMAGG
eukprot:1021941-Pelagomonas_calceolata.AAC.12